MILFTDSVHALPLRPVSRRLENAGAIPNLNFTSTQATIAAILEEEMYTDEKEDTRIYKAVVNHEEQYSIWPADRTNPPGWNDAGKKGTKAECLAYIKEVWIDMRPLSLRKKMEEAATRSVSPN